MNAKIAGIHLDRRMGTAVPTEVRSPSLLVTATPPKTDCARLSQVALEACLSFFFLLVGILWTAPTLKGVSYASEMSNRCVLSLSPSLSPEIPC